MLKKLLDIQQLVASTSVANFTDALVTGGESILSNKVWRLLFGGGTTCTDRQLPHVDVMLCCVHIFLAMCSHHIIPRCNRSWRGAKSRGGGGHSLWHCWCWIALRRSVFLIIFFHIYVNEAFGILETPFLHNELQQSPDHHEALRPPKSIFFSEFGPQHEQLQQTKLSLSSVCLTTLVFTALSPLNCCTKYHPFKKWNVCAKQMLFVT